MCDIIGYAEKQYDPVSKTMSRVLYVDADAPDKVTGGRCAQYFPKVIPLDYNIFEQELEKAVQKIAKESSAELVDHTQLVEEKRAFTDVVAEAKNFWIQYINEVNTEEEKDQRLHTLQDIVQKVFGKPIQLSTVVPSQQELLELTLQEFYNLK